MTEQEKIDIDYLYKGLYENSLPENRFINLPVERRTEEVCKFAVKFSASNIELVPEHLKTPEICEAAVSSNYLTMEHIPDKQRTPEICYKAFENNPLAIRFFKPEQLTREVCELALARADDLSVLYYIPFEDIHMKALRFYCSDNEDTFDFLHRMNPAHITPKLAREIIAIAPELFFHIPDHAKSQEMCMKAIRYSGSYLEYVPKHLKTPELCMEAIQRDPYAIRHLPDDMKSPEFYMSLLRENPQNLIGIPREERTYEMNKEALLNTYGKDKNDFSVISALTEPSLVLQIIRELDDLKKMHRLMNELISQPITEEIALEAVRKDGNILYDIPRQIITPQIADIAIRNAPEALQWVPKMIRTPDMYLYAAKKGGYPSAYVPDEVKNGDNIFSFAQKVEAGLGKPLGYEEHRRLYEGKAIRLQNVQTNEKKIANCEVSYDNQERKLKIMDVTYQKDIKQPNDKLQQRSSKRIKW